MLRRLLQSIGFGGPEQDGRQLARDAAAIVEMIHGQHGSESLRAIADTARRHIAEVHERGLDDPRFYRRGIEHLRDLNRAARNRRDNIAWSGITLAIIFVKAEMIDVHGEAARTAIEGFFSEWAHTASAVEAPADKDRKGV